MTDSYDVVVLGGGGAAEAVMGVLADADVSVAVVERERVGGECPFTGCVPSKVMLHDLAVGRTWDESVARRQDKVDHLDDHEHAASLRDQGATLLRGSGRIDGPGRVVVDLADGGTRVLAAEHVVVATGAGPLPLSVEGADAVDAWTSDDMWTATERPASVVVVGGGPIGLEAATLLVGHGTEVVLVEVADRLLGGSPARVGDLLATRLREQGVDVRTGTAVEAVAATDDGVRVTLDDGTDVAAERLLVAIGKRPNRVGIGLETLGLDPDDLVVGDDLRVRGAANVWMVGDVSGHPPFTHTGNAMGEVAARNLLDGGDRTVDFRHTPMVTFTDPPAALVGSFPDGDDHVVVEAGYDELGRPFTDGTGPGAAALCARRGDGLVVGIAGIGETLDEVSAAWAVALHARYTAGRLADVMQQFPTHAEVTRLLAQRARDELG